MDIPPVLLPLIQAGQGLEAWLTSARQGGAIVSGEGAPFALILAQQAAPAIAAALGGPVLVLPDGSILLEFDRSNLPAGAVVVSPQPSQVHYAVEGADGGDAGEAAASEDEKPDAGVAAIVPGLGQVPDLRSTAKWLRDGHHVESDSSSRTLTLRGEASYGQSQPAAGGGAGPPGSAPAPDTPAASSHTLRHAPPPSGSPEATSQAETASSPPEDSAASPVEFLTARQAVANMTQPGKVLDGKPGAAGSNTAQPVPQSSATAPGLPLPNQEQASPQGGQPGDRGVPVEKSAPSRATTGEEFLVRHAAMEAAARESSAVQSITDPPPSGNPASAGLPQGDAGPLAVTAGVSQPPGPPLQAGGEVVESHAPQQSAFGESMTQLAVKSVRYLVSEGERALRIRLVPESLGEVRVELVSVRDELHLRLVSGSASVREAMESGSDALRNALAKDGVNLVRVTVSADGAPSQGNSSFAGRGQWADDQPASRYAGPAAQPYRDPETAGAGHAARAAWHEGKLSVYA